LSGGAGTPPGGDREPPPGVTTGRILVVDDQKNMCWILDKLLSARGHSVRTAASGAGALAQLNRFDCQVVVVDYRLPDTNGIELVAAMLVIVPSLQPILMTSYGSADLQRAADQRGVLVYFDKPFRNDMMIRAIENALGGVKPLTTGIESCNRCVTRPKTVP
jgi:DNA-binding NtrC family response regulator